MMRLNAGKSPYASRTQKPSPRPAARSAKQHVNSLVAEVMLMRPARTRITHRATNSVAGRDAIKLFPAQLFSHPSDAPDKSTKRAAHPSPRIFQPAPPAHNYSPKAARAPSRHRRTISLIGEEAGRQRGGKLSVDCNDGAEDSAVGKWSVTSRKGFVPGFSGKVNQDAYIAIPSLYPGSCTSLFSICDGHGLHGHEVSHYISTRLPTALLRHFALRSHPDAALSQCIQSCHLELLTSSVDVSLSGSTCCCVLLQQDLLCCANVGDSRAILGKKAGEKWSACAVSRDHKPDLEDEAERIAKAGGRVAAFREEDGSEVGPARVWLQYEDSPGLAMSRSIGDSIASSAGVISTPELLSQKLCREDKFLVVGSDGVFEFLSNEEVISIVSRFWLKRDAQSACEAVEKAAFFRWTKEDDTIDDISVIVVFLEVA